MNDSKYIHFNIVSNFVGNPYIHEFDIYILHMCVILYMECVYMYICVCVCVCVCVVCVCVCLCVCVCVCVCVCIIALLESFT